MKLPPMALTAPSVCPRCDSPAMFTDHCVSCQLQLRHCGACQGVAGPFDRYCGFCGHEIALGRKRSPVWRLWLLAALVPLGGALAFGVSPLSGPAARTVASFVRPKPIQQVRQLQSKELKFQYAIPVDWDAFDYTQVSDPKRAQPLVVASRLNSDNITAAGVKGELLSMTPQGVVVVMGRPQVSSNGVDPSDPVAVLALQVGQLVGQPPAGMKVSVVHAAHAMRVEGKPAAEAVLKVTKAGTTFYFERAYVAASGSTPLFKIDASAPVPDWEGGDGARVEGLIDSLKF